MVFASLLEYATVGYLGKRIAMRKTQCEKLARLAEQHRQKCSAAAAAAAVIVHSQNDQSHAPTTPNISRSSPFLSSCIQQQTEPMIIKQVTTSAYPTIHHPHSIQTPTTTLMRRDSNHQNNQGSGGSSDSAASTTIGQQVYFHTTTGTTTAQQQQQQIMSQTGSGQGSSYKSFPVTPVVMSSGGEHFHYPQLHPSAPPPPPVLTPYVSQSIPMPREPGETGLGAENGSGSGGDVKPSAATTASYPFLSKNLNKMYGVSSSDVDKYSRVVFPVCFVCFNLMYWIIYMHIRYEHDDHHTFLCIKTHPHDLIFIRELFLMLLLLYYVYIVEHISFLHQDSA